MKVNGHSRGECAIGTIEIVCIHELFEFDSEQLKKSWLFTFYHR